MDTTELTYPFFEANQVLTNAHLNDLFEYLDEQQRLTRANLIGVGIACGLDVRIAGPGRIDLSKGCGVTTEGYLIVEPQDVALIAVRSYQLPVDPGYAPLVDPATGKQLDLWELFADDDEPGAQPLVSSGLVLDDKAVVLFLELRKDDLRACTPNSCDDRGAEVTATVRRLLVDVADLDAVIAAAAERAQALLGTDFGADVADRLQLPDLRLPRIDVPAAGLPTTEAVLIAFQAAFRQGGLVGQVGDALTALYEAFHPLVADEHPTNPFAGFTGRFGFLDSGPTTTTQARAMQHYWDLFDDLFTAYDELRWAGVDLLCACCPPRELFPRHLMAGVLDPTRYPDPRPYRHHFVPSPAVGDCEDRTRTVRALFRRLVAMTASFTDAPSLPAGATTAPDPQVRITPTRWGDAPLSDRAIPYYYEHEGAPPLYELWDPVKTARRRANQNLGYRAEEYQPPAPDFVTRPLRYDLEPNGFLRIEGHLGKDVRLVTETLLQLQRSHRLPFEVVALRTGAFDERVEIDLSKEQCRFEDLDTLYKALRAELSCSLAKQARFFYELPDPKAEEVELTGSALPLLREWEPNLVLEPKTVGWQVEAFRADPQLLKRSLRAREPDLSARVAPLLESMSELTAFLPEDIRALDVGSLADHQSTIVEIAKGLELERREGEGEGEPGLAGRLDDIVFRCRLDPFEAIAEEYKRRIREVKQAQFLNHFLERHPGIQHKGGVPLGGTFVLVYHDTPAPPPSVIGPALLAETIGMMVPVTRAPVTATPVTATPVAATPVAAAPVTADPIGTRIPIGLMGPIAVATSRRRALPLGAEAGAAIEADHPLVDSPVRYDAVKEALGRLQYNERLADDDDVQRLFTALTGTALIGRRFPSRRRDRTYVDAVAELADGTVVADFFLPYQCCSDCSPIHYTLPATPLRVDARTGCTNADGMAEVTLDADGATGALSVQVDGGPFTESTGPLLLAVGSHTISVRDDAGRECPVITVTIPSQLTITEPQVVQDPDGGAYQVFFDISGGTPPYRAEPGTLDASSYASLTLPIDQDLKVVVADAAGCSLERTIGSGVDPCGLPGGGAAVQDGYRFWFPQPPNGLPLNKCRIEVHTFVITAPDGTDVHLEQEAQDILGQVPASIAARQVPDVFAKCLARISEKLTQVFGSGEWFQLRYEEPIKGDTTGTLRVDRLECLPFTFDFTVTYVQGGRDHKLRYEYNLEGTFIDDIVDERNPIVTFRPYDGSTSNKCRPEERPVRRCEKPELRLRIAHEGVFPDVTLFAVPSGADEPVAYLWEIEDGSPSLAGEQQVQVQFGSEEPTKKAIRLTAFTERGCRVVANQVIDLSGRNG